MAVEGVLKDELAQARSMQFMRYVIVWLLRLVDPRHAYPSQPIQYVKNLILCVLTGTVTEVCVPDCPFPVTSRMYSNVFPSMFSRTL